MAEANEVLTEKSLLSKCWDPKIQVSLGDLANEKLAEFIEEGSNLKGFPPQFQHAVLHSTVAHCMQKAQVVVIAGSWYEPCVSYILVVAQTGMNKTGASKDAINMITNIEKMNEADYRKKLQEEIEAIIAEAEEDDGSGSSQNEDGVVAEANEDDIEDDLPKAKRRKIENLKEKIAAIKPEKFRNFVCNISPQRLKVELGKGSGNVMIVADEGSSFLKQLSQSSSAGDMKSTFVSLYGAETTRYATQKGGTVECKDPRVQFLGFIQGDLLLKNMSDADDRAGMADRFIYVCPKPMVRDVRKMLEVTKKSELNVTKLIEGIYYSHVEKRDYPMDEDAREMFLKICDENNQLIEADPTNSTLRGMCRKYETNLVRGALINAGIRGGIELLEDQKTKNVEERWVNLNLENISLEKKKKQASEGRKFAVKLDDMEKSVVMQKHSQEIFKIFSHFREELAKTKKSGAVSTVSRGSCAPRVLGDPNAVESEYAITNLKHIEGIYQMKSEDCGKITGALKKVSSAKYFPQIRAQGTNSEKAKFFLKALSHLQILTFDEEANTIQKRTTDDLEGLEEVTVEIFKQLKEDSDEMFNPLEL